MLECITVALEFDTPELFSVSPFPAEAIKEFQEGVKADIFSILYHNSYILTIDVFN